MKKKRLNYKEQFTLGYTTGSVLCFIISFFLGDIMDLFDVQIMHIMLLSIMSVNTYIWSKYYWIGMPKREVWKIRGITGTVGLMIFGVIFFIRSMILHGYIKTINTFPRTMLISVVVMVIGSCGWYIITDYLEKQALKQINARLAENRPK